MIPTIENRPWKVLKSENILSLGVWLNVRQETVELPSGKQIPTWFVLEFPDWINVIAITKDGQFVMEDQYRHGLGVTNLEICAGVIDPGETPLQAAKRELSEETGFGGGKWELFMKLSPNPTNHNNISWTFLATDVEPVSDAVTTTQSASSSVQMETPSPPSTPVSVRDADAVSHLAPLEQWSSADSRTNRSLQRSMLCSMP